MPHTGAGIGSSSSPAITFFAASTAMAVRVFTVALPIWGTKTENKASYLKWYIHQALHIMKIIMLTVLLRET